MGCTAGFTPVERLQGGSLDVIEGGAASAVCRVIRRPLDVIPQVFTALFADAFALGVLLLVSGQNRQQTSVCLGVTSFWPGWRGLPLDRLVGRGGARRMLGRCTLGGLACRTRLCRAAR
jgi:hypothetical protein